MHSICSMTTQETKANNKNQMEREKERQKLYNNIFLCYYSCVILLNLTRRPTRPTKTCAFIVVVIVESVVEVSFASSFLCGVCVF